jgi:hypothetical protein
MKGRVRIVVGRSIRCYQLAVRPDHDAGGAVVLTRLFRAIERNRNEGRGPFLGLGRIARNGPLFSQ